ncbi:MAG TPA: DNA translocase FtsK [Anaerolineae bacterium]|jgi:S-DNA-T family DNA segregation ATPase FtsK/SpoIIIE
MSESRVKTPVQLGLFERILNSRKVWRDAAGLLLSALGVITLVTLLGWNAGGLISAWAAFLQGAFGIGSIVLSLVLILLGIPLVLNTAIRFDAALLIQVIAAEIAFLALVALLNTLAFGIDGYELMQKGSGGGAVGWVLSRLVWMAMGSDSGIARLISIVVWLSLLVVSSVIAFRPLLTSGAKSFSDTPHKDQITPTLVRTGTSTASSTAPRRFVQDALPDAGKTTKQVSPPLTRPEHALATASSTTPAAQPITVKSNATIVKSAPAKAKPALAAKKSARIVPVPHEETLPPITLLKVIKETKNSDADIRRQADILETTLAQFGLAGKVVEIRRGPTVTQFGIEPGYLDRTGPTGEKRQQKIRVGQIAALQNDFALALSASSIRIEAPIPGRGLVGIEVPNVSISMVDLRSMMEDDSFQALHARVPLAVALGRDVSGTPILADLGRMPHLLIAGTTGSGKSVCIESIAVCLCMNNRPEDLKLVLIDPKMVELTRFTGLPHIIGKPESDMDRIPGVLRWVSKEMDSRYKQFAEVGARNLADFNELVHRRGEERLPRIVVLIDELADLMLQSPIETEKTICRLAQMARATGIHMVVATQRPSVDVVTGLIKANFPARISFSVASATDSRVILDQTGAESLLGRGDMLFLNPESGHPVRLQGAHVGDKEIEGLIAWWKKQIELEKSRQAVEPTTPEPTEEAYVANRKPDADTPWETTVAELAAERLINSPSKASGSGRSNSSTGNVGEDGDDDELVKRALDIIKASGNPSTSLLQRKLRIGYPRAARLMEELQEMGYVGAASRQAGKGREVKREESLE